MRFCGLCTLTGSNNIPLRAASASDKLLIYEFEFPRFKTTKNKRQQTPSCYVILTQTNG